MLIRYGNIVLANSTDTSKISSLGLNPSIPTVGFFTQEKDIENGNEET